MGLEENRAKSDEDQVDQNGGENNHSEHVDHLTRPKHRREPCEDAGAPYTKYRNFRVYAGDYDGRNIRPWTTRASQAPRTTNKTAIQLSAIRTDRRPPTQKHARISEGSRPTGRATRPRETRTRNERGEMRNGRRHMKRAWNPTGMTGDLKRKTIAGVNTPTNVKQLGNICRTRCCLNCKSRKSLRGRADLWALDRNLGGLRLFLRPARESSTPGE